MQDNHFQLEPFGSAFEYAGFWIRVGAGLLDTLIVLCVISPLLTLIYGSDYWRSEELVYGFWDIVLNWIVPIIFAIGFWAYKQATPGKMLVRAIIVDAETGGTPSMKQWIIRYLGYIPATLALGLGLFWVGWDSRKQGWHDKLADTVVIRPKSKGVENVKFSSKRA